VRGLGNRTLAMPASVQRTAHVPSAVSKATIESVIVFMITGTPC
jgi:hypothetical protein